MGEVKSKTLATPSVRQNTDIRAMYGRKGVNGPDHGLQELLKSIRSNLNRECGNTHTFPVDTEANKCIDKSRNVLWYRVTKVHRPF